MKTATTSLALVAVATLAATVSLATSSAGPKPFLAPVPGAVNPAVTQATIATTICVRGWTATVRPPSSYTTALKRKQIALYHLDATASYEEDHEISLELGGAPRDPRNLWPEPQPRARAVDLIENRLHREVCARTITLASARRQIVSVKHLHG